MVPYKAKVEETIINDITMVTPKNEFMVCRLESVYFSSTNPSAHVAIFDKDGDQVIHLIPGQLEHNNVVILESPVTVQLPMYYVDSEGNNELILYGTLHKKTFSGTVEE